MELFVYLSTFNVKSNQLMKNLFLLLIVSASVISCKKEDDFEASIIGKWRVESSNSWFSTFTSDKKYYIEDTSSSGPVHLADQHGNYKIDGKTLYFYNSSIGTSDVTQQIVSIKNNILILKAAVEVRYVRVN